MLQRFLGCLLIIALGKSALAQGITNKGKEFWVGYGHHQYMESDNSQNMILYLSAEQDAVVTVTIDNSGSGPYPVWTRTYNVQAGQVVKTETMPKGPGGYDARLYALFGGAEGLFKKRGIHIQSNVPIVAYAHIYASVSSGATMLLPVDSWGYSYTTLNSEQINAGGPAYSWVYVIAKENNTKVRITPSVTTKNGRAAGVPFDTTLMKGEIYQIAGQSDAGGNGNQFSGTNVISIPNASGQCYPIAVFAGSSRTQGEQVPCGSSSGRDNDMQQCFPMQTWGKRYLTAPASTGSSSSLSPSVYQTSVYKVAVKSPSAVVKRNGVPLTGLINNSYYQYYSNTADYIESTEPIMVAQFLSGSFSCNPGSAGDPEMMYLSPIEQGIKKVYFYRNDSTNIYINYLTIVLPTAGMNSLKIDGVPWATLNSLKKHTYAHPNYPGYSVAIYGWVAGEQQSSAESDSAFTGVTYGLGGAESYGYNAGCYLNNLNGVSDIHNVPDTSSASSTFNCKGTPVKLSMLIRYEPTKLVWNIADFGNIVTPNTNVTVNNPVFVDTPRVNGIKYFKYTLPGSYTFSDTGTFIIPVQSTNPSLDNCSQTETLYFTITIKPTPVAGFTFNYTGCVKDTALFYGPAASANGYTIKTWNWSFGDNTSVNVQNPKKLYIPGNYNVKLNVITNDGCTADSILPVSVYPVPTATFGATPQIVCLGNPITFSDTSSFGGTSPIVKWYWDFGNGNTINATNGNNQSVTYAAANNYTVKHVVKISDLCISDTATKVVTVNGKAKVASLTYPTSCLPPTGIANFTTSTTDAGGATITSYNWNFGDPSSGSNTSTSQNPSHTYSTPGSYTVTLTINTSSGCGGDTSFTVNANITPVVTTNTPAPVCAGTPVTLTANGANSYTWTGPNLSTNTGASVTATPTTTASYTVTGTSNGCSATANVSVTVNPIPAKPTVTTPVNYCQNATATPLSATAAGGNTLNWYTTPSLTGGTTSTPTPSTATAGTFYYYINQTSGAGCTSDTSTITVVITPTISNNTISAAQTICAGSPASALATSGTMSGGTGTYTYQWQQSPDGTTWSDISGATSATYDPGAITTTTHYRRVVISGLCNNTSNTVIITVGPALSHYNIGTVAAICEGSAPALIDGETPIGTGPFSYAWESSPDGVNWTIIAGATGEDYQPGVLNTTTYYRRKVVSGPCTAISNSISVTVNLKANGSISGPTAICEYNAADITFVASAGSSPFSISYTITNPSGVATTPPTVTGLANNGTINVIPAGSAPGNYTIVLNSVAGSNGCVRNSGLNTITIAVTPKPAITITPVAPICEGTTATLTASGATTYTWTGPGLSSTTGNTVTAAPTGSGSFQYTVQGTANGCNNTASVNVTVNPKPAKPNVISPVSYPQYGTSAPLQATALANHTLTWYNNAGLTGGSSTAPTPPTSTAGTFTYYVTQTSPAGCMSDAQTITVLIEPGIAGNTIGRDTIICQGNPANPVIGTGTLAGGSGTYTFQWQVSTDGTTWTDIPGATSATYSPGVLTNTTYYKRIVTSGLSTSTSNVVTITIVPPLTNYNISADQTICEGNTPANLIGQTPSGAGPFAYTWESSVDNTTWNVIAGATGVNYQPSSLTATTYYRRKVAVGSCSATSNVVTITVNALANGSIAAPAAICEYESADMTFTATAGASPFKIGYTITDPSGVTSPRTVSNVSNGAVIALIPVGSAPGVYSIRLDSIINSNGCNRTSGLNTITVTVKPTPAITVNDATICEGDTATLTATGATTYTWSGSNLSSTSTNPVKAAPTATSSYQVTGTTNGCSAQKTATITVNPRPVVNISVADNEICLNDVGVFSATATITSGTVQSYHWDFDNGNTSTVLNPPAQTYSTHRTYVTSFYAVSDKGCNSVTDTANIQVDPLPVASFISPSFVCLPNNTATFQNQSTIANSVGLNYTWTFGDAASGSSNTSTATNGSHIYPDSANYTIKLSVVSVQGCSNEVTHDFNAFLRKPVAKFGVTPDTLCQGIQNVFTDSSFASGSTIQRRTWNFGDGSTLLDSVRAAKTYTRPGNYQISLIVENTQGCSAETYKNVLVYLQPVIHAGPSFVVPQGTTITFNASANSNNLQFAWTSPTGGTLSNPNILKPQYVANQDGKFILTATGQGNCQAWDSLTVKVLHNIIVPNAFSPNGDGINDKWTIPNLGDYPGCVVEVYNRYGQQVFKSFGYTKSWDGTFNGTPLPVGVYYYIIDPKNGFPRITGYVTIVK